MSKTAKKTIGKPKYNTQRHIIQMCLNSYGSEKPQPILLPFPITSIPPADSTKSNSQTEVYSVRICHNAENETYPISLHTTASKLNYPRYDSFFPSAAMFLYDDNGPVSANVSNRVVNLSGIKHKLQILKIVLQLQLDFYKSNLRVPLFLSSKSMINTTLVFKMPFNILEENVRYIALPGYNSCYEFNSNRFSTTIFSIQVCVNSNFPFSADFPKTLIESQKTNVYSCRVSKNTINMCGGDRQFAAPRPHYYCRRAEKRFRV